MSETMSTPSPATPAPAPTPAETESWPFGRLPSWMGRWPELSPRLSEVFGHLGDDGFIRVEEVDEGDQHVVRAELPGVDPEKDIEITVRDGTLTIKAERSARTEEKAEGRVRSEFRYGSFHRRLGLPPGASESDVTARYNDGILEVRVPVAPPARDVTRVTVTR